METISLSESLTSWGMPQDVIQNFVSNGLTLECLSKLKPEHLKELCPHLGTRILLEEKIAELITACAPTDTKSTVDDFKEASVILDDISLCELMPQPDTIVTRTFPDFDLRTLLQTSPGGNSIVKFYETYGLLNNTKRNQLTDIIIKHIYTHIVNCRITYEEYNLIAAKIITVFPKESIGIYFTKPISKCNSLNGRGTIARGKLIDKVRNLLYKYGDRKRRLSNDDNMLPLKKPSVGDFQNSHTDVLWLNSCTDPWDEVIKKWKGTFHLRKQSNCDSIHEFFNNWKILRDSRSCMLINIDFDLLYPEKGLNFYLNWDIFYEKLTRFKYTKDDKLLNIIQTLENIEDESKIPAQIYVLGHLVPPRGRLSKKVKFTTQEAIDSIFICVEAAGDIDKVIEDQKLKAKARRLSVQPYIILQGNLLKCSSPLLIIDDVTYKFDNIKKAFDILFKSYHVFNARYPRAGDHLYLIIQRSIYKIQTKYDNLVPYIVDVLNL